MIAPTVRNGGPLHGREELLYFVGSGTRGRTFLFQREGYWFETPINWYAKKGIWDMAPNYQRAAEMPFTLPADSGCLSCHASNVQAALPDARNHYRAAPFETGGITCERCHGDASEHLAQGGKGPILNPDKLAANLRDSACLQCHLEAEMYGESAGPFPLRLSAGKRDLRLSRLLRTPRRIGSRRAGHQPVGSPSAERLQARQRRQNDMHDLPRPAWLAVGAGIGRFLSEQVSGVSYRSALRNVPPP